LERAELGCLLCVQDESRRGAGLSFGRDFRLDLLDVLLARCEVARFLRISSSSTYQRCAH